LIVDRPKIAICYTHVSVPMVEVLFRIWLIFTDIFQTIQANVRLCAYFPSSFLSRNSFLSRYDTVLIVTPCIFGDGTHVSEKASASACKLE
jgi:hypothetical protein